MHKPFKGSQGGATKMIVLCITHSASRKIWADVIPDTKLSTVKEIIERVVPPGGVIFTDDASHYEGIDRECHEVTHSAGEYGRITQLADGLSDTVTTNHTESAWSMFRRAISGVNHKMSPKHLRRYVKAFAGRWNIRALDTEVQMLWVFKAMLDRRITFADLTADNGLPSGSREGNAIYPDRRPKYNRKS